ncbi:MAG: hypothetical protein ABJO45_04690 [Lentilitoribacter sp.]
MISFQNIRYANSENDSHLECDDVVLPTDQRFAVLCTNQQEMAAFVELASGQEEPDWGLIESDCNVSFTIANRKIFQSNQTTNKNLSMLSRLYGLQYKDMQDFVSDIMGRTFSLDVTLRALPKTEFALAQMAMSYAVPFHVYIADRSALPNGDGPQMNRLLDYLKLLDVDDRGLLLFTQSPVHALRCCTYGAIFDKGSLSGYDTIDAVIRRFRKLVK